MLGDYKKICFLRKQGSINIGRFFIICLLWNSSHLKYLNIEFFN